jgi:hypothetical protein
MDIGKCFKDAWELFKIDLGPLIVVALVGAVIIGVVAAIAIGASFAALFTAGSVDSDGTLGGVAVGSLILAFIIVAVVGVIVGGWQYATLYGMLMARIRERRQAEYGDMTRYMSLVGPFILAYIVLGIIISIGIVLLIIPGVIFATWWLFTLVVMADRRIGFGEAMSESKALASQAGFWNVLGAWIVLAVAWGVASAILGLVPYLGSIASLLIVPFALAYTVSMYLQARGEGALVDQVVGAAPAGGPAAVAPPPPGAAPYAPPPAAPPAAGGPAQPAAPPAAPPAAEQPAAPAPQAAPAPPPPPAADDAWKAAADPLAAPQPAAGPAAEPHVHEPPAAGDTPAVDAGSGRLEKHCSQCGSLIEGSDEFCQSCALEVSGGHEPDADAPQAPDEPEAPPPAPPTS